MKLRNIKNKYFCEVKIDNKKALFFLDTGARTSSITSNYAKDCKVVSHVKSAGQTGKLGKVKEVKEIENIDIAGLKIEKHKFIVNERVKKHYQCDGVLGADILSKRNLILDFKKNIIKFTSKAINEGVSFKIIGRKILFDVIINNKEVKDLIFDTGATLFSIDKELYKKLNLKVKENENGYEIKDANGHKIDYRTYLIDDFQIGNHKKKNLKAYGFCFQSVNKINQIKENGIIGRPVFDGYIFTFDFNTNKCLIE